MKQWILSYRFVNGFCYVEQNMLTKWQNKMLCYFRWTKWLTNLVLLHRIVNKICFCWTKLLTKFVLLNKRQMTKFCYNKYLLNKITYFVIFCWTEFCYDICLLQYLLNKTKFVNKICHFVKQMNKIYCNKFC